MQFANKEDFKTAKITPFHNYYKTGGSATIRKRSHLNKLT